MSEESMRAVYSSTEAPDDVKEMLIQQKKRELAYHQRQVDVLTQELIALRGKDD